MLIDFEKAFDAVYLSVLYKSLKFFNFQEGFIRLICTFNTNMSSIRVFSYLPLI